jgi:hypothetical protein
MTNRTKALSDLDDLLTSFIHRWAKGFGRDAEISSHEQSHIAKHISSIPMETIVQLPNTMEAFKKYGSILLDYLKNLKDEINFPLRAPFPPALEKLVGLIHHSGNAVGWAWEYEDPLDIPDHLLTLIAEDEEMLNVYLNHNLTYRKKSHPQLLKALLSYPWACSRYIQSAMDSEVYLPDEILNTVILSAKVNDVSNVAWHIMEALIDNDTEYRYTLAVRFFSKIKHRPEFCEQWIRSVDSVCWGDEKNYIAFFGWNINFLPKDLVKDTFGHWDELLLVIIKAVADLNKWFSQRIYKIPPVLVEMLAEYPEQCYNFYLYAHEGPYVLQVPPQIERIALAYENANL